jgi:hypothetical protein
MSLPTQPRQTPAFYAQSVVSFAVSLGALVLGIAYLPVDGWMRAYLSVGVLYTVTSAFTLAKCVRDQFEASKVVHRVDEVRLERLLAEHDPFRQEGWTAPAPAAVPPAA